MTYQQLVKKYPELNWKEVEEIFDQNPDDVIAGAEYFDRDYKPTKIKKDGTSRNTHEGNISTLQRKLL